MEEMQREYVAGLSLDERRRLISGHGFWHLHGVASRSVPHLMVTDGPHGLRQQADDRNSGVSHPATCFPTASALAATWDRALVAEVGAALGREARGAGVGVVLGPGVNLKRHPAAGRNFEYFSEDPYLSGHLAAAFIRGVQDEGVGTSLKHFAVNNQETFRLVVDAVVDERTLRELYLPAFEIAVRDADPWTVMCAYNRCNGVYCSDDRRLLTGILRDEWGFDGLVMSDWGATNDRAAGLIAGMDVEMPGSGGAFDPDLDRALADGSLRQDDIDRSAARVVRLHERAAAARARHGADPVVDLDTHHDLARRAAADGCVLLTNDGTLPLRPAGTVGVIGEFARTPRYQGAGSSLVNPTRLDQLCGALTTAGTSVEFTPGYDGATGRATSAQIAAARELARRVDVAVLCVGLPESYESEGFDRTDLQLPSGHRALIAAVCAENDRTVVVLANGAPVDMGWADRPAAVVEAYLGGQAAASGLADVLTGRVNPAGRLAESVPCDVADLPSDVNFPGVPRQVEYREGLYVGYRFHDTAGVPARFAFGHGLSYSTFEYGDARLDVAATGDTSVTVSVPITNTGRLAGAEVVQCYVRDVDALVERPDKELKGFEKVWLDAGASAEVVIELDRRAFAFYDVSSARWCVGGGGYEILLGSSSVDIRATASVILPGDAPEAVRGAGSGVHDRPGGRSWVADDATFAERLGRPIPTPTPVPPFDRTVTVAELGATRRGRVVQRLLLAVAGRQIATELAGDDERQRPMMEAAVREAPLRSLSTMSGGMLPMWAVDLIVRFLGVGRSLPSPVPGELADS